MLAVTSNDKFLTNLLKSVHLALGPLSQNKKMPVSVLASFVVYSYYRFRSSKARSLVGALPVNLRENTDTEKPELAHSI